MKKIVFIHGMFQNAESWKNWVSYFSAKGYECVAESWPLHEGKPATLRGMMPAGLGDLRLETIAAKFRAIIEQAGKDAILVGHSVGGLLAQKLINEGYGSKGVCICSVAPNKMLTLDWDFFKNSITIANPLMGDEAFTMDEETFHSVFCNTLSEQEAKIAYENTATHDSRNVLRDCMGEAGHIELDLTDKPLLFISGSEDKIIPAHLCKKNAEAYDTLAAHKEFENRDHFLCNDPGWEQVAAYVSDWIETN